MPTIAEIASLVSAALADDARARTEIDGVAPLDEATDRHLSFVGSHAYVKGLATTRAAAVLVDRRVKLPADVHSVVLVVEDADLALAQVLERFAPPVQRVARGTDSSARVDPSASMGKHVSIGPFVVIGARARIGDRCVLHAGAFVGDDCAVGDDCVIWPNVVVRERVTIGHRVVVHPGAVIGADGFGYRWDGSTHAKVPHVGTVVIEDDVEIGACACIDRAKVGATRIGRGTKIDNLVQVAHNCVVGPHCILAGQAGLAGSVTLGARVVLGGATSVADHLTVGPGTISAGRSAVAGDIEPDQRISGMPAIPHRQTLREQAALRRLPELISQIKKMEEEIEALKQRLSDAGSRRS